MDKSIMRKLNVANSLYEWIAKVVEDEEVQNLIRRKFENPNEEELTQFWELFHRAPKVSEKKLKEYKFSEGAIFEVEAENEEEAYKLARSHVPKNLELVPLFD